MRLPTYTVSQVLAGNSQVIDLRSPAEFQRDHMPGAVNVPLLDDEQRAIIGTLYKRESPQRAFREGLHIIEARMGRMLERILGRPLGAEDWQQQFHDLAQKMALSPTGFEAPQVLWEAQSTPPTTTDATPAPLIVHCWRGGMRSQSVAMLLHALGQPVGLLAGGYKAYRQWLMAHWQQLKPTKLPFIVLRGPTGVGKTDILRRMEALQPGSTLDLEGLAAHRSSVLGAVGLEPVSQPKFESNLWNRLAQLGVLGPQDGDSQGRQTSSATRTLPIFVEGESRKVGDSEIPAAVFAAMGSAPQVHLTASTAYRIEELGREYLATEEHKRQTLASLGALDRKLGHKVVAKLREQIQSGEWRQAAAILLERHYDPLYRRGDLGRDWLLELEVDSQCGIDAVARRLLQLLPSSAIGGAFGG